MSTLLIKNARCIATFDDANPVQARELKNASLFIRDHRIAALGPAAELPQNAELFGWLRGLYPIWAGLTPDMVQVSTQMAMAELLMSGCTTSRTTSTFTPTACGSMTAFTRPPRSACALWPAAAA
jgi:cytosine/adenosine deaminase-related metal-dependent hydrolase